MPSHGGSRLNASKPEANPKTRCPINFKSLNEVAPTCLSKGGSALRARVERAAARAVMGRATLKI